MLLKLGRDVAPYEIYQMVHILMLLWQHARFQSPASSKLNITICDSTRQNTWSYLRRMPVPPSLGRLFNIFSCLFYPMQVHDIISFIFLFSRVQLIEHFNYVLIVPFDFRRTVVRSLESNKVYSINNSVKTSIVTRPRLI